MQSKNFSTSLTSFLVRVDCVVFGIDDDGLKVLLIKKEQSSNKNCWALPGSELQGRTTLEEGARKNLELIGLRKIFLEQLFTYSRVSKNYPNRFISVAYYALVNMADYCLNISKEFGRAAWWPISSLPVLSSEHKQLLDDAVERLRGKVVYQPIGFELLPRKFTLSQLQRLYEVILERILDKRNFRKKILAMGFLRPLEEREKDVPRRAALLYSFDERRYKEFQRQGFIFEI